MKKKIEKIKTLFEALPYIKRFHGNDIVIKYGGSAMVEEELKKSFTRDIVLMKYVGLNPIVVHGGGPQIGKELERIGKEPRFINGIRVTDDETMDVVEKVLVDEVNSEIVGLIEDFGGKALGLGGKKSPLIKASQMQVKGESLGRVGQVENIDLSVLRAIDDKYVIPVIAPVGIGEDSGAFNINADTVAGALAVAIKAEKLILLTDVEGVLDGEKKLISEMNSVEASKLIDDKVAIGGMVPKLTCCIDVINDGVHNAHIIDGRVEHAVLLEIFTDEGIGTIIGSQ
ncbi:MAG: acetylglutamate kinase [Proteobacteria bacterium]|nr:acetylglutamate kinase [Pseudomonadota bacterium]